MFSAPRIVGLLAKLIGIDSDLSAATREESKLAETFANLIREAVLDSLIFETKEEIAFSEPDDADDADPLWNVDDLDIVNDVPPSDRKRFQFSRGYATLETVVVAAQYYRSTTTKPHLDVAQMKTRFRFIGNEWDLRKMEMHAKENDADSTRRVSRITGLQNLSNNLLGEVMDAFKEGFTLHDCDLEVMALDINREHHYVAGFEASPSFITRFKRKHRICSRQTTKFVSKATGLIQPLDVYFFRPFKGLVRRIQSYGFKNCPDFIAYQRDSILKLISLCYSIIRAPTFRPLIQYAWFRAGYLDSPPPTRFQTPVQVCFPRSVNTKGCAVPPCTRPSFILCPKCHKTLCFKCFVIAFHSC